MVSTSIEWVRGQDGSAGMSWNALRAYTTITRHGGKVEVSANHCEHVNEACRFCYAERGNRRLGGYAFKPGHRGKYRFAVDPEKLLEPVRRRKPTRIFVESMSDAFGEWWPDEFVDQLYAVMAICQQHTFINLTKRPARRQLHLNRLSKSIEPLEKIARELGHTLKFEGQGLIPFPLPNVIEGVSVSCQEEADEFVPILMGTQCHRRVVSAEPLLGPIDFTSLPSLGDQRLNAFTGNAYNARAVIHLGLGALDWVITGGESGAQARPMHPDWARSIRDQCKAAGVAFHFKQWGEYVAELQSPEDIVLPGESILPWGKKGPSVYRVGKKAAGRLLDGVEHNGFPTL